MVQTPVKPLTLEAFLELPETQPASEYIDGHIIQKPMPQGKHSRLQKRLIYKIESVLLAAGIAEAFPELRCSFGGRSVVPDVVVLQKSHMTYDADGEIANVVTIAPDWTIEILPPSLDIPSSNQQYKKAARNISHCLDHGCQMGWLLDPEEKTVAVSPQDSRSRILADQGAIVPVPDWAVGLELTVGEIFGWLLG
jgi:Uma2 family endonuclease